MRDSKLCNFDKRFFFISVNENCVHGWPRKNLFFPARGTCNMKSYWTKRTWNQLCHTMIYFPVLCLLSAPPRCPLKQHFIKQRWQTLHKRFIFTFFPPIVSIWIVCVFCCWRAWCVTFSRQKLMMKTITDVVFCLVMTQNYMDEQIILRIYSFEKGRHRIIISTKQTEVDFLWYI